MDAEKMSDNGALSSVSSGLSHRGFSPGAVLSPPVSAFRDFMPIRNVCAGSS